MHESASVWPRVCLVNLPSFETIGVERKVPRFDMVCTKMLDSFRILEVEAGCVVWA